MCRTYRVLIVACVILLGGTACHQAERRAQAIERLRLDHARDKEDAERHRIQVGNLAVGDSIEVALAKLGDTTSPEQIDVTFPGNVSTGYTVVGFEGHVAPESDAQRNVNVALIFLDGRYRTYLLVDAPTATLSLFSDLVSNLYQRGKLSFYDAEKMRSDKWFETWDREPDAFEKELVLFQEWQARRVDRKQSTVDEYRFLVAREDRELHESRDRSQANKELAARGREEVAIRRQELATQQEAVRIQRAALVSQALINAFRSTYVPHVIHCNTTSYGSFASTSCF